jgi:hypothetical protein
VYRDFNLNPQFPPKFFGNTILKFADSSNKKPKIFWDTTRALPLQSDEKADYKKKDSLEQVRKDPHYQDSLDKKHNKPRPVALLLTGQTFTRERKRVSIVAEPFINIINYNTVEGAVINLSPDIIKRWQGRKELSIKPTIRYGFGNAHFNAHVATDLDFGKKTLNNVYLSGGRKVFQFNNDQPISPKANTMSSLISERNLLKTYEASFLRVAFTRGIGDGFTVQVSTEYQDRAPLENTTNFKFFNVKERNFTPNYPVEITNSNIIKHQALIAGININWRPKAQYIEYPGLKLNIGSKYPTLNLQITKGIYEMLNSDVNYTKWMMSVYDDINFRLAGNFSYRVNVGGFLKTDKVFVPDYKHFSGNRSFAATEYLNGFQLLHVYRFSNTNRFYTTSHFEHHLNGMLSNKIPVIRRLNWFFVIGANALYLDDSRQYYEYFFSIENIFKIFRLDFVRTYDPKGNNTSGITFSARGLINRGKED